MSLASPAVLFGIELMTVIERHYPERLITAFVVNTPYFFALFWKIVKPLMPAATKKRLNIMQDQKVFLPFPKFTHGMSLITFAQAQLLLFWPPVGA